MINRTEWKVKDVIINRATWMLVLIFGILLINSLHLSIFYLILNILLLIFIRMEFCTRCEYYGKICGFGGGKITACFFKKKKSGFTNINALIFLISWVVMWLYPPVMATVTGKTNTFWLGMFVLSIVLFNILHMVNSCKVCKMKDQCPSGKIVLFLKKVTKIM